MVSGIWDTYTLMWGCDLTGGLSLDRLGMELPLKFFQVKLPEQIFTVHQVKRVGQDKNDDGRVNYSPRR